MYMESVTKFLAELAEPKLTFQFATIRKIKFRRIEANFIRSGQVG